MTIGIYKLIFEGTDKVYIGQSKNIEYRFREHKYALRNGLSSKKLLQAYTEYGEPVGYEILCECEVTELDTLENEAIELYSSYTNGFNSFRTEGGSIRGNSGIEHWNQKYSKTKILRVFSRIYRQLHIPYADIAKMERVNVSLVNNIALGTHHLWLKQEYPDKFQLMLDSKRLRKTITGKTIGKVTGSVPKLISPKGEMFEITNIRQFCITHPDFQSNMDNARSALGKLIKGRIKAYKGWKLG